MAQVVVMPQLGNTVESCLITAWLVKVGDAVDVGTLLCEIETDKVLDGGASRRLRDGAGAARGGG